MPESNLQTAASNGRNSIKDSGEREMLMRAFSAGLALLSFLIVCIKGFVAGNSFVSVIQHSLVAMIVGAVGGYLAAMAIQYVVKNEFDRQYRTQPGEEAPQAATIQSSAADAATNNAAAGEQSAPRSGNHASDRQMASVK